MKKFLDIVFIISVPILMLINTLGTLVALLWLFFTGGWKGALLFIGLCVASTYLVGIIFAMPLLITSALLKTYSRVSMIIESFIVWVCIVIWSFLCLYLLFQFVDYSNYDFITFLSVSTLVIAAIGIPFVSIRNTQNDVPAAKLSVFAQLAAIVFFLVSIITNNLSISISAYSIPVIMGFLARYIDMYQIESATYKDNSVITLIFQKTKEILDEISDNTLINGPLIFEVLQKRIRNTDKEVIHKLITEKNYTIEKLSLMFINLHLEDCLISGHNHIYRGVLGVQGRQFMEAYRIVNDKLLKKGYISQEISDSNINNIEEGIREIG